MMKFVTNILLAAGLTGTFALDAGTIFFRGGEVFAAEMSSKCGNIVDFDETMFPQLAEGRIYAAVTMKFPAGRTIGVTDYRLVVFDHEYPCVAIKTGNGSFKGGVWAEKTEPNRFYTLLFVLDKAFAGLDDREKITLQCAYPDGEKIAVELTFVNRHNAGFKLSIPADGAF